MYKHIALFILSGLFLAACDKAADAPAEAEAPAAEAAVEAPAAPEAAEAPAEVEVEASSGEIGLAECDEYIAKTKACMEKMPAEARDIYAQNMDAMLTGWKESAEAAPAETAAACQSAIDSSKAGMEAMGCDW